jgi:hypothetical protein
VSEVHVAPNGAAIKAVAVAKLAAKSKGEKALDAVEREFRRELIIGEAELVAAVLWSAHTYVFDKFKLTPRLFATSADPGSGKSTLLGLVRDLSANAKVLRKITVAYLTSVTKQGTPTLVADQLDNSISKQKSGDLLDALIGGAERGAQYGLTQLAKDEKGVEKREAVELDFFFPVALGKIGDLPDRALNDRCITIRMHPPTPEEDARLYTTAKGQASVQVQSKLAAWMAELKLAGTPPEMPEGFRGRMRDKWRPLFAIADAAGGAWPERARASAVELEAIGAQEEPKHVTALRNLVAVVADWPHAEIFTRELQALGFQDIPGGGALLPKVGLTTQNVRRDGEQAKGLKLAAIREAAARYRVDCGTGGTSATGMPLAA